jgi:hypothetical protein
LYPDTVAGAKKTLAERWLEWTPCWPLKFAGARSAF